MKPEKVISAIETTIVRVTSDIKKKQGNIGSDKLNSLSKLVNSYNRLLERTKDGSDADESDNYYDSLEKKCLK
jgi:hypothetical protein